MDLVKSPIVPQQLVEKYERDANRYWDLFYRRNEDRFFKDRHYFDREFPELLAATTILEVGCGVGNTVFPLLELNLRAYIYACDFAPSAITLVQTHPLYLSSGRVHAFVADITEAGDTCGTGTGGGGGLAAEVPMGVVDACTMVFVLSAISPEKMPLALRNVGRKLKAGTGKVLFRDYAEGDLAQERLSQQGRVQQISERFFARWDGTRAYYFSEGGLVSLFEAAGFRCEYVTTHLKVVENRKQKASMHRRYVQGVFTYLGEPPEGSAGVQHEGSGGSFQGERGAPSSLEGPPTVAPAARPAGAADMGIAAGPARRGGPLHAGPGGAQPEASRRGVRGVVAAADGTSGAQSAQHAQQQLHLVPLGPLTVRLAGPPPSPAHRLLAHLLSALPDITHGKRVLELGGVQGPREGHTSNDGRWGQQAQQPGAALGQHTWQEQQEVGVHAGKEQPRQQHRCDQQRQQQGQRQQGGELHVATWQQEIAGPAERQQLCVSQQEGWCRQQEGEGVEGSATCEGQLQAVAPPGLASLAALRWCRFAVATTPSKEALAAVRHNAALNSPVVVIERLRLMQLSWHRDTVAGAAAAHAAQQPTISPDGSSAEGGYDAPPLGGVNMSQTPANAAHGQRLDLPTAARNPGSAALQQAALLAAFPSGFDVIVGADLAPEGSHTACMAEALACQLAALLAPVPLAVVLLCQTVDDDMSRKLEGGGNDTEGRSPATCPCTVKDGSDTATAGASKQVDCKVGSLAAGAAPHCCLWLDSVAAAAAKHGLGELQIPFQMLKPTLLGRTKLLLLGRRDRIQLAVAS